MSVNVTESTIFGASSYLVNVWMVGLAFAWLGAGTRLVLLVDPANETVHVYRSADEIAVFGQGDQFSASDVVDGWQVTVAELFR